MRYVWRRRCTPSSKRCTLFFGWFGFSLLMVWWACYVPVAAAVRHVWADDDDDARRVQKRIATTSGVGGRGAARCAGLSHGRSDVGRVRAEGRES